MNRLYTNPKYSRVFEWGRVISIAGAAQILVQATGLLTGILIIRMLPTKEYAYYTLANTMLATMTVLADGGISSGVMAEGGKVWKDKTQLGKVLATGLALRRQFALFSILVAVPILIYLLVRQGAEIWVILLVIATLIPSFYAALSDSLLEIVPKLHQDIRPLQANQVLVNLGRLFLSTLSIFFPFTFVVLLANGIPRMYGNMKLKGIVSKFAENQPADEVYKKNILGIVKKMMPGAIYYCISGQITIWLISFFGNTDSIAKIGALGRLSMALSILTVLFGTLITPRFARLMNNGAELRSKFVLIQVFMVTLCTAICGIVYLFPQPALWILGQKFQGLEVELLLSVIASCLALMSGIFFSLSASRGWPTHPAVLIAGNILFVVAGAFFFDVTTLKGALWFNIFINLYPVSIHSINFYYKTFNT